MIVLAAVMLAMQAAPGFADDETYYIELGGNLPDSDAQKEWETLSAKYKRELGGLKYYPKKVLEAGTHVTTRIQAGPVANQARAEKICSRMFAHDVPCFVIEEASGTPPSMVISLAETSEEQPVGSASMPWQAAPAPPPAPAEIAASPPPAVLPWRARPNETMAVDANAHTQAKVEVAEAVRVPLSDTRVMANAPVSESPLPSLTPPAAATASMTDDRHVVSGWLNVASFPDEDMALAFWQGVRTTVPRETAGLHVRIMKPLISTEQQDTSLNIGPFDNREAADAFCRSGVLSINPNLRCRFGTIESAQTQPAASSLRYAHADDYEARRRAVAEHRREAGLSSANPGSMARNEKTFWVQVVSADSEMDALRQWEGIRTGNADLLKGKRGSVSARRGDANDYAVRVGPLADKDEAITLCHALKDRKIDCSVLASM